MMTVWISTICAFAVGIAAGFFLIPVLIRLKFGQEIREIGPKWHKKKAGTPTMGGVIFIIASLLTTLIFDRDKNSIFIVCTAFSFGLVGFAGRFYKNRDETKPRLDRASKAHSANSRRVACGGCRRQNGRFVV